MVKRIKFFEAVVEGDIAAVTKQLKKGISVNLKNDAGDTALHVAVGAHKVAMIHFLLQQPEIDPNQWDATQKTPLEQAMRCYYTSSLPIIEALLSSPKVDLYSKKGVKDRNSVMVIAIRYGDYGDQDLLDLVLKREDFDITMPHDSSAPDDHLLNFALKHKKLKIFKKLFFHQDKRLLKKLGPTYYYSCLWHAIVDQDPETLKFLLENRGPAEIEEIKSRNQTGYTLLHYAVSLYDGRRWFNSGHWSMAREIIRILLNVSEININAQCQKTGNTAFHCVTQKSNDLFPWFLARSDLDLSIQNNEGKTVLDQGFSIKEGLKHLAADFFAPVVFASDDLLTVNESLKNSTDLDPETLQNIRFIETLKKLPMELQMRICNLAVGLDKQNILSAHSEPAFQELAKYFSPFPEVKKILMPFETLRDVIATIQKQRKHNPITTWLSKFFGLNLRQEKSKLTEKFIGFLNKEKDNLSSQDFLKYAERFKVAQQALERSRLKKGSKKAAVLMKDLIMANTDNETALLSQFQSHQKPLDIRKQYGIRKEERRYEEIKGMIGKKDLKL